MIPLDFVERFLVCLISYFRLNSVFFVVSLFLFFVSFKLNSGERRTKLHYASSSTSTDATSAPFRLNRQEEKTESLFSSPCNPLNYLAHLIKCTVFPSPGYLFSFFVSVVLCDLLVFLSCRVLSSPYFLNWFSSLSFLLFYHLTREEEMHSTLLSLSPTFSCFHFCMTWTRVDDLLLVLHQTVIPFDLHLPGLYSYCLFSLRVICLNLIKILILLHLPLLVPVITHSHATIFVTSGNRTKGIEGEEKELIERRDDESRGWDTFPSYRMWQALNLVSPSPSFPSSSHLLLSLPSKTHHSMKEGRQKGICR